MSSIVLAARFDVKGIPTPEETPVSHSFACRAAAGALLSLLVLAGVAPPAAARPDPGGVGSSRVDLEPTNCPLRRIDTQLVRCDSLTGAGVPAPLFIPEVQPLAAAGR